MNKEVFMWKKIAIVAVAVIALKVTYDYFVRKMEEAEEKKASKIPEDKPDITMDKV
jgi:hypothetical protein